MKKGFKCVTSLCNSNYTSSPGYSKNVILIFTNGSIARMNT